MKPSVILKLKIKFIIDIISRYPVTNPRVFGSVARGEDVENSDLDILVDPMPGVTLFELGALQEELVLLLGVPVHLCTPGDIPAKYRGEVISKALPLSTST